MDKFLSCDWGTSSLRLRLADTKSFTILAEEKADKGILGTFNLWNETGNANAKTRLYFYLDIIRKHIELIRQKIKFPLNGTPIIISGMASSSIGMMPLAYGEIPFSIDGSGIITKYLTACEDFTYDMLLISGVKSEDDVMRGEETQLIGCLTDHTKNNDEGIFIFPGTHSKHITVKNNQVIGFKTYMTGEFFELLSEKSILKVAVERNGDTKTADNLSSFTLGVEASKGSNLLNTCFRVRTNELFNKLTKKENFNYLSGLIIGAELQELLNTEAAQINLCCGSGLKIYYETAFQVLGLYKNVHTFPSQWVDEAVIRGQYKIYDKQVSHE